MTQAPFDVERECSPAVNTWRKKWYEHMCRKDKREPTAYELELQCFACAPFGSDAMYQTLVNCVRFQWPSEVLLESQGLENYWLKRLLKGACTYKKLSLVGCASSGKTYGASVWAYTKWKAEPWTTSIYLSTTTSEAGEARTWGTIKDLHDKDRMQIGVRLDYRHMIVLQEDSVKERDYRDSIACVCIKEGAEGHQAVKAISGRHNKHVIWVCDELVHMNVDVLESRANLRANEFSQFIGISNKPAEGDPQYLDAEPHGTDYPDGWRSVNPDMEGWPTRGGYCIYFDGEKSPNLLAKDPKKPPFPMLLTQQMINDIAEESGGTDSAGYWRQVRGFPKVGDVQDTVLTGELIRDRGGDQQPLWGPLPPTCVAGLDLGFRKDGDPCVADFAKFGKDASGLNVIAHERDAVKLTPPMSDERPFEDKIAREFLFQCGATIDGKTHSANRNCHHVALDISGDGGIIAQAIVRISREIGWKMEVHSISFLGSPDDNVFYVVAGKRKPAKELFDRKVSQLWYAYRLVVQASVVRGLVSDSNAVKQLCMRKVIQDEKKRWMVEPKKEMKKRLRRSPDHGDSRVLSYEMARRLGFAPAEKIERPLDAKREWQRLTGSKTDSGNRRYADRPQQRRLYASSNSR